VSVPRRFVGAWERESLQVGGTFVAGIGQAVWVESGGTYVDVRAAGTVASGTSFGGRSTWRSPRFTWHHDLDLHPKPGSADRGDLSVRNDRIRERGTGIDGGHEPYEEAWRRLPSENFDIAIAAHDHGLAVRVGDHAALIVVAPARTACALAWRYANGRWSTIVSLGPAGNHPDPHASGWRLTRGWTAR